MAKFNRKDALKYVNKKITEISNKGLDVDFLLKGKTPEQYAYSAKSLGQFKKQVKRTIERPKVQAEVAEYDVKRMKNRFVNAITPGIKSIIKFAPPVKNISPEKMLRKVWLRKQTKKELFYLKEKYFMELRGTEYEKRVNRLIKMFGTRLDLAHELIQYVADSEFTYPFEKDTFKTAFPTDYMQHMVERLLDFEDEARRLLKLN